MTRQGILRIANIIILVYAEFGASSTDSITMTLTYGSSGLTTAKTFNILTRQISCTATYKYVVQFDNNMHSNSVFQGPQQTVLSTSLESLGMSRATATASC